MKRILLVSSNTVVAPYPVPPLGLCLLAESLAERHDVRVHDGLSDAGATLPARVRDFQPEVIGIGIRNLDELVMHDPHSYVPEILERFVRPLRQASDAPLVLGGSGFSLFPHELMARSGADFGVVGEGELALPALIDALERGRDPSAIAGVLTRADAAAPARRLAPAAAVTAAALRPSQLERWIDFSLYRDRGAYSIQTKRGCSHECIYCTYPMLEGRHARVRTPERIVDEIEAVAATLGAITFEFVDSTFNDPPGHAEAICREIVRRRLRVRLRTMGVNPRGVSRELVELMREAGFAQMDSTPDSASEPVIANLRKNFSLAELRETAKAVREAAMPTMWFFLFGGPGETEQTFADSLAFIDREILPEDMVLMGAGLRVYPGTRLEAIARAEGSLAAADSLLAPRFYVSAALGAGRLQSLVEQACASRPHCVPAWESTPDAALRRRALELRAATGSDEPMFRSLLRARRERITGRAEPAAAP